MRIWSAGALLGMLLLIASVARATELPKSKLESWDYHLSSKPQLGSSTQGNQSKIVQSPAQRAQRMRAEKLANLEFWCGGPKPFVSCIDVIISLDTELRRREALVRETGDATMMGNLGLSIMGCPNYCLLKHFPTDTPNACKDSISNLERAMLRRPQVRRTNLRDVLVQECGLSNPVPPRRSGKAPLERAIQVIGQRQLLSPSELACSLIVDDGSSAEKVRVEIREKHNTFCGGDPETSPRRFTLEIDVTTGAARWDYNSEMEMRPVPARTGRSR
jgi:hypothetical protein